MTTKDEKESDQNGEECKKPSNLEMAPKEEIATTVIKTVTKHYFASSFSKRNYKSHNLMGVGVRRIFVKEVGEGQWYLVDTFSNISADKRGQGRAIAPLCVLKFNYN